MRFPPDPQLSVPFFPSFLRYIPEAAKLKQPFRGGKHPGVVNFQKLFKNASRRSQPEEFQPPRGSRIDPLFQRNPPYRKTSPIGMGICSEFRDINPTLFGDETWIF